MKMKPLFSSLAMVMMFCTGCWFKPDGGFYLVKPKVTTSGDGLSYENAYVFHHVDSGYLTTAEITFIRDRYWVTKQRASEDFYHVVPTATISCYDSMQKTRVSRDGKIYDVITFTLPEGRRTLYFDVSKRARNH